MALHRLLSTVLLLALVPVAGYAAISTMHPQAHGPASRSSTMNLSLTISASGNSTKIGNSTDSSAADQATDVATVSLPIQSQAEPASVPGTIATIASTVLHNNTGVIVFNVTGTSSSVKIVSATGSTTYNVLNGTGIFNQQSMVVVVHAMVSSGSSTGHLILIGVATPVSGSSNMFTITFSDPQSKLAGQFFLSLKGTLTVSA